MSRRSMDSLSVILLAEIAAVLTREPSLLIAPVLVAHAYHPTPDLLLPPTTILHLHHRLFGHLVLSLQQQTYDLRQQDRTFVKLVAQTVQDVQQKVVETPVVIAEETVAKQKITRIIRTLRSEPCLFRASLPCTSTQLLLPSSFKFEKGPKTEFRTFFY